MAVTPDPTIGAHVDVRGLIPAEPAADDPARGDADPGHSPSGPGLRETSDSNAGPVVALTTDPEAQTDDPLINPTNF